MRKFYYFETQIGDFLKPADNFFVTSLISSNFGIQRFDQATHCQSSYAARYCGAMNESLSWGKTNGLSFNRSFQIMFPDIESALDRFRTPYKQPRLELGNFVG
jgi:hypothetical protein